jgi:hypothetical protein
MRCHSAISVLVLGVLFSGLEGCSSSRGIWDSIPWVPHHSVPTGPISQTTVRARNLALTVRLEPFPVGLSQTRRVEAWITLKNRSKRFVQLEFPTTQRFDASLRDEQSAVVALWSEDQAFEPVPGILGINPGEQVEYKAALATRDLLPGHRYTLSVVFPIRDDLKAELGFVPQK